MKKRGTSRIMFLGGELAAALFLGLLLISVSFRFADSKTPVKNYIAEDLAMVMDSLFSSPGNIIINYTEDFSDYTVELKDGKASLYSIDEKLDKESYNFFGYKGYEADFKFEKIENIQFARVGDEIIIGEKVIRNMNEISCGRIGIDEKENLKGKKILIDPFFDEKNPDLSKKTCVVANNFISHLIAGGFDPQNILSTLKFDEGELKSIYCEHISKAEINGDSDLIISITVGNYDDKTKNNVKAFVVSGSAKEKESKKLSCLIINSILKDETLNKKGITGASIVPFDPELLGENFPEHVFENLDVNERMFVMLELGNSNVNQEKNLLDGVSYLGESIYKGLEMYGKQKNE